MSEFGTTKTSFKCATCGTQQVGTRHQTPRDIYEWAKCAHCGAMALFTEGRGSAADEARIREKCRSSAAWVRSKFPGMFKEQQNVDQEQQNIEQLLDAAHCQALNDPSTGCTQQRANARVPAGVRTKSMAEDISLSALSGIEWKAARRAAERYAKDYPVQLRRPLTLDEVSMLLFVEANGTLRESAQATALIDADIDQFAHVGDQVVATHDHERITGRLAEITDSYATIETRNGNTYVLPGEVNKAKADDVVPVAEVGPFRIVRSGARFVILDRAGVPRGRRRTLGQAQQFAESLTQDRDLGAQVEALVAGGVR